jgi:hypothetical protein
MTRRILFWEDVLPMKCKRLCTPNDNNATIPAMMPTTRSIKARSLNTGKTWWSLMAITHLEIDDALIKNAK